MSESSGDTETIDHYLRTMEKLARTRPRRRKSYNNNYLSKAAELLPRKINSVDLLLLFRTTKHKTGERTNRRRQPDVQSAGNQPIVQ